jgi:hypothetical protein
MSISARLIRIVAGGAVALAGAGWLGLQVRPASFPAWPEQPAPPATVPLPSGLPEPVARFYRAIYGADVPVVESAVLTGRADLRVAGLRLPGRFRFIHRAGYDYRHYIEATVYGWPILKVNETYIDGRARLELPSGVVENSPKTDQAANLNVWAEAMMGFPSLALTDARARWEPIDQQTARLVVPFGAREDALTARFDPSTGLLAALEASRWKAPESPAPIGWRAEAAGWTMIDGQRLPSRLALTWADEDVPWLVMTVEEAVYNAEVAAHLRA